MYLHSTQNTKLLFICFLRTIQSTPVWAGCMALTGVAMSLSLYRGATPKDQVASVATGYILCSMSVSANVEHTLHDCVTCTQ